MTTDSAFGAFELEGWEDQATAAEYDRRLSPVTTQSTEALLDAARVHAGHRVLDVATGAGYVAAAAARRGARPVGIDFSATQVRLARQRHPDLHFEQADAQALPYDDGSFDAVVCAFGLCHLPEPDHAVREAFRVLRPGGRFAFSVWDAPERAAALGAFYAALRAHGSMDSGLPVGPDFFLFSNQAMCAKSLHDAGFAAPVFKSVPQVWRVDDSGELFDGIAQGTVRAAATLRVQSPAARDAIRAAVCQAVEGFRRGDACEVPMPAVVAAGVKPYA